MKPELDQAIAKVIHDLFGADVAIELTRPDEQFGDFISRLYEAAGAKVLRINYTGDVGRHVAITMWSIIKSLGGELPDKLPSDLPLPERLKWLGARYVEGNNAFEDDDPLASGVKA